MKTKPQLPRRTGRRVKNLGMFAHHHLARRPHEFLSRKSKAYRRYHEWRWHKHLHIGVASGYLALVVVFISRSF